RQHSIVKHDGKGLSDVFLGGSGEPFRARAVQLEGDDRSSGGRIDTRSRPDKISVGDDGLLLDEVGHGRIVNIASSSAQTGSAHQAHYAASKGGVSGFTKALAMEVATSGITGNAVPPGFVNTEGLREAPVDIEGYAPMTPMKRPGRPENIAAAVAFLASDDADYITGHTSSVNGGRYLN
ncbi:hypothetical protein OY671_010220, partial [Metschnikowia pulcherrima]